MSARLEPQDLGLGICAACDHDIREGEPYHRGIAKNEVGVLLYILCQGCAQRMLRDTVAAEKFSNTLLETLNRAALVGLPAEGRA
jgi:hypothetical protein